MPQIKLKRIVSFSNEDKNFQAENLLKQEPKKWKCENATDKQASVLIELEKSTVIDRIEVGNEGSAFIEILVSRTEKPNDENLLVPVTSFMKPLEAKEKQNLNRVKIFNSKDDFESDVSKEKWNQIKVICTQPFNKSIQYGISFIKLFSPDDKADGNSVEINKEELEENSKNKQKDEIKINTGVFQLKKDNDSSKDNDFKIGISFNKWKEEKEEREKKGDDEDDVKLEAKKKLLEKKLSAIKSNEEKDAKKQLKADNKKKNEVEDKDNDNEENKRKANNNFINKRKKSVDSLDDEKQSKKPMKEIDVKKDIKEIKKEENNNNDNNNVVNKKTLLKGVIFALSGFQNPERSNIRDKGLQLGAKYKPDWDKDCTHLICAFAFTPKYNEVKKTKGIIVKKDWFYECDKKSKKLNEKDFQFEEKKNRDSDSDSDNSRAKPSRKAAQKAKKVMKDFSDDEDIESENSEDRDFVVDDDDDEEEYDYKPGKNNDDDDDEEEASFTSSEEDEESKTKKKKNKIEKKKPKKKVTKSSSDDESDDDDDNDKWWTKKNDKKNKSKKKIEKKDDEDDDDDDEVKLKSIKKKEDLNKDKTKSKKKLSSSSSTEENSDMDIGEKSEWQLPDIFSDLNFFIYGNFNDNDRKNIKRWIIGYGGNLHDYISDKVDYVITDHDWDEEFDKSLKENPKLKFVSSDWLNACASRKKRIAYEPFSIVPDV